MGSEEPATANLHTANFGVTKQQKETTGLIGRLRAKIPQLHDVNFGVTKQQKETQTVQTEGFFNATIERLFRAMSEVVGVREEEEKSISVRAKEVIGFVLQVSLAFLFFQVLVEISGIIDGRIERLSKFRTRVASSVVGIAGAESLKPVKGFAEDVGVRDRVTKGPGKSVAQTIGVLSDKAYSLTFARLEVIGVDEASSVGVRRLLSEAFAPLQDIVFRPVKQISEDVGIRERASFFFRAVNLSEVVGIVEDKAVKPILQRSSVIGIRDIERFGVGKSVSENFTGEQSITFRVTKQLSNSTGVVYAVNQVKTFGLIIRQSVGIIDREVSKPIITFGESLSPVQEVSFGVTKGVSQGVGVSDTVARVRTRVIKVAQSIGLIENRAMGLTRALTETISPEQPITKGLRRTLRETIVSSDFDQLRVIKNPVVRQIRAVGSNILTILDSGLSRFRVFNTVNVQRVLNPRNQIMIFDQAREVMMERSENSVKTLDRQNDVETFDEFNES